MATKAFVSSVAVLYMLGLYLGELRGRINGEQMRIFLQAMEQLPEQIREILAQAVSPDDVIEPLAKRMSQLHSILFIGRGVGYPAALEGALKLKEISYIHPEAFPAGELNPGSLPLLPS